MEDVLPALHAADQRLQEHGRPRHRRHRLGFIWKTYGFAYIEELELLREAGFLPLEIIRSATMWGAKTLYEPRGEAPPMGVVRAGMLADLVIVPENPLSNLKVLYGTGHMRLNPQTNRRRRSAA
jgi:hypothetical protein